VALTALGSGLFGAVSAYFGAHIFGQAHHVDQGQQRYHAHQEEGEAKLEHARRASAMLAEEARQRERDRAEGDAHAAVQLLKDAEQGGRPAHLGLRNFGETDCIEHGELHRATQSAEEENGRYDPEGRIGRDQRAQHKAERDQQAVAQENVTKAKGAHHPRGGGFHGEVAREEPERQHARCNRVVAEGDLEHQRQQEGRAADRDAEERASDQRDREGLDLEGRELDQRVRAAQQVVDAVGQSQQTDAQATEDER
jgi:hypothetical protein